MASKLTRDDLEDWAAKDLGFLGLHVAQFSSIFLAQVWLLQTHRIINTMQLMDEIKYLEGIRDHTNTGNANSFRHPPLKGLSKKHYTDASFILKNIGTHFGLGSGGNKRLHKLVEDAINENTSGYLDDQLIGHIAHGLTIGAFEERSKKRLTGEWIIFQSYNGKNYYLTLANHDEGDEAIFSRVCQAYEHDFPFLKSSPPS